MNVSLPECSLCGNNSSILYFHADIEPEEDAEIYVCEECSKKYTVDEAVRRYEVIRMAELKQQADEEMEATARWRELFKIVSGLPGA